MDESLLQRNRSGGSKIKVVGNNSLIGGTALPIVSRLVFHVNVLEQEEVGGGVLTVKQWVRAHGLSSPYYYIGRIKYDGLGEWFMFDYNSIETLPTIVVTVSKATVSFQYTPGTLYPNLNAATVEMYFLGLQAQ